MYKFKNYVFGSSFAVVLILLCVESADLSLFGLLVYFGLFFIAFAFCIITFHDNKK